MVQLYTQVAKVAAQQTKQDKLDKFHREKKASLSKLRTSGEADRILQRAGIKPIGEQRRKQQEVNGTLTHRAESCVVLEEGDSLNLV